jgi:predicted MFS family arabinose efflux permease
MRNPLAYISESRAQAGGLPGPYLLFLGGLLISRLGDALYTFALPWISYELTRSAVVMGSLYATGVLPVVLFGPVVGVVVDRWDRRRAMWITDVVRALLVGLIPMLQMAGLLKLWHLYAVSFALSVLSLLFDVATVAVIPAMGGSDLTRANASYQLVQQLAELAGPVLAGLVISAVGGFHALWLDVLSFGATLLALAGMPSLSTRPEGVQPPSILRGMAEGFRWLVRNPLNLSLSLQAMVGNFGYSAAFGVLMFYLRDALRLGAGQISVNYALLGAGGLVGSLLAVPLVRRFRRGLLIPALLSFGASGFLFAAASRYWLAPGIGFGLVAVCNVAWNVLATGVRQETVPSEMLGRVLSFSRVLTRLAMPVGALLGGVAARSWSASAVFWIAFAAKGVEVVIALLSPMRRL